MLYALTFSCALSLSLSCPPLLPPLDDRNHALIHPTSPRLLESNAQTKDRSSTEPLVPQVAAHEGPATRTSTAFASERQGVCQKGEIDWPLDTAVMLHTPLRHT